MWDGGVNFGWEEVVLESVERVLADIVFVEGPPSVWEALG